MMVTSLHTLHATPEGAYFSKFGWGSAANFFKPLPVFRPDPKNFKPKWQKSVPYSRQAGNTYMQNLKIYTHFQTKTAQQPYPLGWHMPIYSFYIREYPPPPPPPPPAWHMTISDYILVTCTLRFSREYLEDKLNVDHCGR